MGGPFLAVDWGTTNRRVYLIDDGAVIVTERDGEGVTSVSDFAASVAGIRAKFGDLPMLLAGMVGSNIGWQVAPYVLVSVGIDDLAAGLLRVDDRSAIVPGVSTLAGGRADIMRGEEVQLLGAVAAGLAPSDALLVQPGTHSKWVEMKDGRIADFTTTMTGELFALIRSKGLLAPQLQSAVELNDAFRAGLHEAARRDLATSLFGIRAAKLLGTRAEEDAASFASGLLIGSEVAARLDGRSRPTVHILSDAQLGALYVAAIEAFGGTAVLVDSHGAFAAGIIAIESRT